MFHQLLVKVRECETPGSMTPWDADELLNMKLTPVLTSNTLVGVNGPRQGQKGKTLLSFSDGCCLHFAPLPGLDLSH